MDHGGNEGRGSPWQSKASSQQPLFANDSSGLPCQPICGDSPASLVGESKIKSSNLPGEDLSTTLNSPATHARSAENVNNPAKSDWTGTEMPPPPKPPIARNSQMTSEEYNAQLLSDPRMRNSSVVNPDFLRQYYQESRLHHLSTWKAELKAQLQAAARDKAQSQGGKKKWAPGARKYIIHVDFDSFFAAVAILKRPDLRNKPVAIAHGSGSGSEIASCNYVARASGVKNGMWMKSALEVCPKLQVLPYDFPAYEEASRKFYNSVLAIDGIVQSVSIDEALVDVTESCLEAGGSAGRGISEGSIYREQAKASEIGQKLRDSVKEKTGCAVSVGIGGNILQAKVALRKAKPAGQFQLKPEAVLKFMEDLNVRELPGVGHSLSAKLEELGATLVKDMREISRERLVSALGPKTGIRMWEYARGVDKTEVGNEAIRKSVSAEVNWGIRFVNQEQAEDFVSSLCGELNRRLVENLVKGKQLTLKVMRRSLDAPLEPVKHLGHGKCDIFNKSIVIGVATNATDIIAKEAILMLRTFNFSPGDIRGLGVQMTKLEALSSRPSTNVESSQRQLNFVKSPSRKKPPTGAETDSTPRVSMPRIDYNQSTSHPPGGPGAVHESQFIMPTQADPMVVYELPNDVRSRLVAQSKSQYNLGSASPTPAVRSAVPALPPQSQLDPNILLALPDDVRDEVLGYYGLQPPVPDRPTHEVAVAVAPPVPASRPPSSGNVGMKPPYSPSKKRRGRPTKFSKIDNTSQTLGNFVLTPLTASPSLERSISRHASPTLEQQSEVSAEFLAALPEDIRQEVLEEETRTFVYQQSHVSPPFIDSDQEMEAEAPIITPIPDDKRLPLPPLPERPVFTSQRFTELPDLREAVDEWHSAFLSHGPYGEDVEVLSKYLSRVILDEKDIEKAVAVVRWLMWLVDEDNAGRVSMDNQTPRSEQGFVAWAEAINMLHACVQSALEARGLPLVEFQ